MSNKVVHALYDDDDVLLSAVKNIRKEKYNIEEVYTPFLSMVWIRLWVWKKRVLL